MAKNPLKIPVFNIDERGLDLDVEVSAELLDLPVEDRVRPAGPVYCRLRLARRGRDVTVRGRLEAKLRGRCDRCLDEFDLGVDVPDVCYFFEEVEDDRVDLTAQVREDIVIVYPDRLLCGSDCAGLCPHCGANLNREACQCSVEAPPSGGGPWAELDGLQLPEDAS